MELGQRLKQARMEAGLSQRQLCGDTITRNMLSLIENGNAKPSMDTLKLLAARLEKPVSYFLEEENQTSPNSAVMDEARQRFDSGDCSGALQALEGFRQPDLIYGREKTLLEELSLMALAEQAIREGRFPYARELLEKVSLQSPYFREEISRRRLLLLGRIPGISVSAQLPSLDEELLLRAEESLAGGDLKRAACLLDAAQGQNTAKWNLLRGKVHMQHGSFREAAHCLHHAEKENPKETAPLLERCYRELEDYKQAYIYACKQK